MTPIKTQDYIQIKLATFQYKIFASTHYLKTYGVPQVKKSWITTRLFYGEDAQPPLDKRRLNWLLWQGKEINARTIPRNIVSMVLLNVLKPVWYSKLTWLDE